MEPELRKHSCKLGIDYDKKWILCAPEDGADHVVLTTPVLYAWHVYVLGTEEGIRHWVFIEAAGYLGKNLVLKLLNDHKIVFVGCKEIFVYGLILSEKRETNIFMFDNASTKTIQGSPFLFRKTVFLSHANSDKALARDIASRIERTMNVWIDEKAIVVGDSISEKIDDGLQSCDALILCLSRNSVNSPWVRREYAYALHNGIKVLPVRLDDCSPPPTLADTKYIDFFGNEEACIEEIFRSVEQTTK
jgi:hypothetical protein